MASELLGFLLLEKGPEARPTGMTMSRSIPTVGGLTGAAAAMVEGEAGGR